MCLPGFGISVASSDSRRTAARHLLLAASLVAVAALAACRGDRAGEAAGEVAGTEEGSPYGPLTAESLQPVVQPVRHGDGFVSRLQVVFARPVVPEGRVGELSGTGTTLRIEPEVPGELRWSDVSTLTFEPSEPFEPATEYRATLEKVQAGDAELEPPAGGWTATFTTPALAFDRLALQSFDAEKRRVEVDVMFSAPVDPRSVRRAAQFRVLGSQGEDRGVPVVQTAESGSPNVVRFGLESVEIRPGRSVRVELRAQGGELATVVAAPVQATIELGEGPDLAIKNAYLGESATGFFVEVICDDSAVEGQRWYWDRHAETGLQISPRCELAAEELRRSVHVEPAVALEVAPGEAGFKLLGDLRRGPVALRIDAGARSKAGGTLREAFATELVVPARSPQVRFQVHGRYLPRAAWSSVPVRHLNVKQAQLTVRHVPPENLVFWMSAGDSERTDERTSNLVAQSTLPLPGALDEEVTSYLDLRSHVPEDSKGLLEVRLVAGNVTSSVRVVLTDLVLVAKRTGVARASGSSTENREEGEDDGPRRRGQSEASDEAWGEGVLAWALDAHSLEPVRGVEVKLVRPSGQAVDSCRTDGNGACNLVSTRGLDPTPPLALVATRGPDVTYLRFRDLEAEVQEERVAGEPYREPGAYRAALYSERGAYRPGEVAHLAAIVRDERQLAPPADMPAVLEVLDPRGKTVQRHNLRTNSAGFVAADLALQDFAMTGRWQARLQVADRAIATHRFQVEELVPERMKVTAKPSSDEALRGDPVSIEVDARYLFGGVPGGAPVELQCELQPSAFAPRASAEYQYGVWTGEGDRAPRPLDLGTVQGNLDEEGAAALECGGGESSGALAGAAVLVARAAVAEAGSGRTTVAEARLPVHPEHFYVGLKSSTSTARSGEEVRVEGTVVDWEGRAFSGAGAPQSVKVQVLRLEDEYGLFFDEDQGHETYRRYQRAVVEESLDAKVTGGRFELQFVPQQIASGYVVRAEAAAARTDLVLGGELDDWYWSPYDSEREVTPRPQRPTWIALTAPERVRAGEAFEIRFEAPYRGRALLTLETDGVIESAWRRVDAGAQTWRVEVDDFVSNVYATAFVIKDPHLESAEAYLPDRAFGVASIPLEPVEFTQQVTLHVPEEVRSSSDLTVELDVAAPRGRAAGPVYATVAAVDEGLLSLTRFESPDPFDAIFPRRALGVSTFETVGWAMMLPPAGSGDAAGGDQLGGALGRVQPITPVALWSGLVEVPASGKLRVTLPVPEYRGQLRVMAVTADQRRMGRAEAQVFVRDPLVLQTTVPRFLIEGDETVVPAMVTNVSGSRRAVTVELAVEDLLAPAFRGDLEASAPIELVGPASQTLDLADQASGAARFRVRARPGAGAARLKVTATAGDLRSSESTEVPLLPAGERIRKVRRIDLREVASEVGERGELDLRPYVEGWKPMSERTDFWLTTNPYADVLQHSDYLLRYPYGCLEQTTSSTRPLLHVTKFLPAARAEGNEPAPDVDAMVQSGVDRVFTMQTPSGGFAYWPGGSEPAYWASAYGLHLLLDAQKAGYAVPADRLEEALDWMEREITRGDLAERDDWYSKNAEPYMHYVLALAGRPQKARAEQLLRRMTRAGSADDGESREQVFLLQAALQAAGDHRYEARLKRVDTSNVRADRSTGWTFYSDRRRRGLQLATLVDLFGRDPAAEPLAELVAEALRGEARSYTTQELVWGITGLGKLVEQGATLAGTPQLVANGAALEVTSSADLPGNWSWRLHRASEHRQLALHLPERGDGALFLVVSSEGVPVVPPADLKTGGDGLRLERRFHRAEGEVFDPQSEGLDLGELVHVELEITNTGPERISNLALVDRVGSGLEIENPRLGRDRATDWVDPEELWEADHLDVRDDRLEVFGTLEAGETRRVVYSVRATAAGRFTMPASAVEAMYDPRRWARGTGIALTVRGAAGW